jgi:DNA-binding response OmpR family regulator
MTASQTILIVEDEATIREVVRKYLEHDGFTVLEAESGPDALALLRERCPDLLLLDIMLPGLDGFSITHLLRHSTTSSELFPARRLPIIMLTSRSDEADRIAGFELGIDDYVAKPFSPRELVMRVKAVLRRTQAAEGQNDSPATLVFNALRIDPTARAVRLGERSVELTAKEFDLLFFLAKHPRQVFSRSQLLDHVWGHDFYGDESTVTVHIRRLREKLEPDAANPTYVQTVWGIGYKFDWEAS